MTAGSRGQLGGFCTAIQIVSMHSGNIFARVAKFVHDTYEERILSTTYKTRQRLFSLRSYVRMHVACANRTVLLLPFVYVCCCWLYTHEQDVSCIISST